MYKKPKVEISLSMKKVQNQLESLKLLLNLDAQAELSLLPGTVENIAALKNK